MKKTPEAGPPPSKELGNPKKSVFWVGKNRRRQVPCPNNRAWKTPTRNRPGRPPGTGRDAHQEPAGTPTRSRPGRPSCQKHQKSQNVGSKWVWMARFGIRDHQYAQNFVRNPLGYLPDPKTAPPKNEGFWGLGVRALYYPYMHPLRYLLF